MNLASLRERVAGNLGRTDLNDRIVVWLNDRQKAICRDRNFSFLRASATMVTNPQQQSYSLPLDFRDDLLLGMGTGDGNYRTLPQIGEVEAMNAWTDNEVGEPSAWMLGPDSFSLYPIPDRAYQLILVYYKNLPDLAADTDETYLTKNYADLLAAGATADGFAYLQQYEDMAAWEQRFQMLLSELRVQDVARSLAGEGVLRVSSSQDDWRFMR